MSACGSACSRSDRSTRCWRAPRSKSVEAVARAGVAQGLLAVHVLDARSGCTAAGCARPAREAVVDDRDLDVDGHAAERVDDLLEAVEVDLDEVRMSRPYSSPRIDLSALKPRVRVVARPEVGAVRGSAAKSELILLAVDATPDTLRRAGRHRHVDRVARQAEHRDLLGDRVDRDRDQRVGVDGRRRCSSDADEQDVQPLLAVPRRDDRRSGPACPTAAVRRSATSRRFGASLVGPARLASPGDGRRVRVAVAVRRRRLTKMQLPRASWASRS